MSSMIEAEIYAILLLGLALLLVVARSRAGQEQIHRLLRTAVLLAAIWTLGLGVLAILTTGPWWAFVWQRTAQAGLVILALVSAEFAGAFVQRSPRRWPWRLATALGSILVALALDILPTYLPMPSMGEIAQRLLPPSLALQLGQVAPAGLALAAGWLILTVVAWWTALAALHQAVGAQHRNRIRYLLAVLLAFLMGDLLIWIGAAPGVYVGLAARLVGLHLATVAVLRYHLPDIRRLILRIIYFALLCTLLTAVYAGGLALAGILSGRWAELLGLAGILLPTLALGAAVSVAAGPPARRLLDRLLLGQDRDLQKALRTYSQQVTLILDAGRLAEATLDWLQTTFGVRRSAFILLAPQGKDQVELRILCSRAMPDLPPQPFAADGRFLVHFDKTGRPLSQYDLDMLAWFRSTAGGEREWLRSLAVDLYVPILVANKLSALLALGPKAGGRPYTDEDQEALLILAGQAGTALDNTRLVDDLRRVQGDLHQLGSQLGETNRQLQRLDQAKTDFVAIAAHELRTPLSQIYGYSDALSSLKGEELSDGQVTSEFIEGISRGARRLKRVIDAMIDISLIETGSLALQPITLPIGVAVKNAVATIRPVADQRQIRLAVEDLSKLPYIQADSVRLEQALVNLLSNAIKFTPDGGRITISGQRASQPPGQDCVELLIADTGIGVDPPEQELIFAKFYRAENPLLHSTGDTRFKGAGPGLGLAIAKGVVDAHGGRIWVESPGRDEKTLPGSTFHLRLPVKFRPER